MDFEVTSRRSTRLELCFASCHHILVPRRSTRLELCFASCHHILVPRPSSSRRRPERLQL